MNKRWPLINIYWVKIITLDFFRFYLTINLTIYICTCALTCPTQGAGNVEISCRVFLVVVVPHASAAYYRLWLATTGRLGRPNLRNYTIPYLSINNISFLCFTQSSGGLFNMCDHMFTFNDRWNQKPISYNSSSAQEFQVVKSSRAGRYSKSKSFSNDFVPHLLLSGNWQGYR